VLLLGGCASDPGASTRPSGVAPSGASSAVSPSASTVVPAATSGVVPPALAGLPVTVAEIGDLELEVVVAETPGTRSRGLMGIDAFGTVDGMAFVFDAPTETGFYMKDVLAPLDVAFIGPDGAVVDVLTMALCTAEPCPIFHAAAPFKWALETPEGGLAGIEPGDAFALRAWAE
jgi:uncharacterized membrane protein (UPF0127 family)